MHMLSKVAAIVITKHPALMGWLYAPQMQTHKLERCKPTHMLLHQHASEHKAQRLTASAVMKFLPSQGPGFCISACY